MNQEFDPDKSMWNISHHSDVPFDSFDRIYALYLIDKGSELINTDLSDIKKLTGDYLKELMAAEEYNEFISVSNYAYDNYEREGMAPYEAFFNIINVAKKGRDIVLKDSYYDGGWFGAS